MTSIADINDKWAAYAGPGGWNGIIHIYEFMCSVDTNETVSRCLISSTLYDRSRYVRSRKWRNDIPGVQSTFQHMGYNEGIISSLVPSIFSSKLKKLYVLVSLI